MTKVAMDCKKLMVREIAGRLNDAGMLIVTNYKGLTSQALNELRRELRNNSSEYLVIKDSMAKRALAEGPNKTIAEFVEGEVGIAIDKKEDAVYITKILTKFAKGNEFLKIRGGIMGGALISKEDIAVLAALPSREVLLGKLANVLNAPIQGLASVLHGILSKIVYALSAVKDKKTEARPEEKSQDAVAESKPEQNQPEKPEEKKEEKGEQA